jgi:hypothetical protein
MRLANEKLEQLARRADQLERIAMRLACLKILPVGWTAWKWDSQ